MIKNDIKLTQSSRTPKGTDEAAADLQSVSVSRKIYVSYILQKCIIFKHFCILYSTNTVKTCDYLYLDEEIYFANL